MTVTDRVLIFDVDADRSAKLAGAIAALGLLTSECHRPSDAVEALGLERPSLAVVIEDGDPSGSFPGVARAARSREIATVGVIDPGGDPIALADRAREFDAWVARDQAARELPARVAGLLDRPGRDGRAGAVPDLPAIDARFLALVVHDLRTPLNVIGLTIRAIAQTSPDQGPEFEEDLTFLQENAKQIEKMLSQLADYCRLLEGGSQLSTAEFEPRRFLSDFLEDTLSRQGADPSSVRLELGEGSPQEVALDPHRVRLALQHALANALIAAGEAPVRLRSGGRAGRWIVEIVVDKPPPSTVSSLELHAEKFERLAGSAAERRGLDLAIAARVSELFGGSARLEVEPGRKSTVILDWPERLPAAT